MDMIRTRSFQVKCAAFVEEVLIVTTPLMVAYGIISMAQLEPGLQQVMEYLVIGQEMMVTTVALGATMMAKQISEPGRTLTILNQVNGYRQLRNHLQDILPSIQLVSSILLMSPLDIGLLMQMKLMVVFGSELMGQSMEVGLIMMDQQPRVHGRPPMEIRADNGSPLQKMN